MTSDQSSSFGYLLGQYRRHLELTQAQLAEKAGCSTKYISMLERGERSPSRYVLGRLAKALGLSPEKRELLMNAAIHPSASSPTQIDWGRAPHPDPFFGRKAERSELKQWIVDQHCRVVAIVGFGGIGKSSLAAVVTEQVKDKFAYVFWRSLQDVPRLEQLLQDCLQFLSDHQRTDLPTDQEEQISLLIEYLREHRCLIVLDNVEPVLQAGSHAGQYREGYTGYGKLLRRIGEADHKSCLLLTSRELPKEVARLQGTAATVRSLKLPGVEQAEGREIIKDKGLFGSDKAWGALVRLYSGNPLSLKVVAEYIRDLFGGNIAEFLKREETVFGDIREVLEEQFERLSSLEQEIMYWLAIERESVSLDSLQEDLVHAVPWGAMTEALGALRRRSMVEADGVAGFTLLPVIMEYMTNKLVERMREEIDIEKIDMFASHALIKAQAKDYVRDIQVHLILKPLKEQLLISGKAEAELKLKQILSKLREMNPLRQGYAAGNVLNLLIELENDPELKSNLESESDLRDYDFSSLKIRQAYLQDVNLQEVNFAEADFEEPVFTDTFGSILSVAFSPDGQQVAAGTANGEIRVWQTAGGIPLRTYLGHTQWVFALAFSRKGDVLASGSGDQTIRLWDTSTEQCLKTLRGHTAWVRSVAFSPDGKQLVSCGEDMTVCLWELETGQCLHTLRGHSSWVRSVAFSPDGATIASGSEDATVRLWDISTEECLGILSQDGHTKGIWSVAFSPDGTILASGSEDLTIRLWDVKTQQILDTLHGHTGAVRPITFSPDGTKLASCSEDTTIRLWDIRTGLCLKTLHGHSSWTRSVDFSPDGRLVVSGSEDQTVRLWDASTGYCLKVLRGHTNRIRSISFSPSGDKLVSCSEDKTVSLWDINSGKCVRVLKGHTSRVRAVAFNPNGNIVASGSDDQTIRLWDISTRIGRDRRYSDHHKNSVRSVAFSPDGKVVVSGSDDQTIRLWDISTGESRPLSGHSNRVRAVAFSPDSKMVASGSEDTTVRLWDTNTGECLHILAGHEKRIWAVAFSPDSKMVASGSEDTTVRLWDTNTGECLKILREHSKLVWTVAFSPDGKMVASGSEDCTICLWQVSSWNLLKKLPQDSAQKVRSIAFSPNGDSFASASNDGTIKLWNVETRECIKTFRSEGPYARMNITHVKGLTEAQKAALRALGAVES